MTDHTDLPSLLAPRALDRREALRTAVLLLGAGTAGALTLAGRLDAQAPVIKQMVVYKDPNCGCCTAWIEHVQKAGFTVDVKNTSDMDSVKSSMGLPDRLASCHTAKVGTYVIEGHVPADLIVKLLREKPAGRGLAVPGMPVGSPGMEMGGRKDAFDVLLFDKSGKTSVYAKR